MKRSVLIVDDDPRRGGTLTAALEAAFECRAVATLDEAFAAVGRRSWDAALVDYDLGRHASGLELLQALRDVSSRTVRVLYSEYYCGGLVRDATRLAATHAVVDAGAPGFPGSLREALERLLPGHARGRPELPARGDADPDSSWFAESGASREFARRLRAAAEGDSAAFLFGEHGTGKHLAARLFRRWRARWSESHARGIARPAGGGRRQRGPPVTRDRIESPAPGVVILEVPPLRQRIEDIPALARHCLERHARQTGEPIRHLTNDALNDLLRREWWGNVRELHGVLVRACQRAGPRLGLSAADLPRDAEPQLQPSQSAKEEGQRDCVLRQLRAAGNVSGAARLEGITRTNYIRLMRRLGIIRADTLGAGEPEAAEPMARLPAMRRPRATARS